MSKRIRQFINSVPSARTAFVLHRIFDHLVPTKDDTAITAFATGGQTNAQPLKSSASFHDVTVVATAADSIVLPAARVGEMHLVKNSAALSMQVFAPTPDTIDSTATATGVAQLAGDGVFYMCVVDGNYIRLGGVSSTEVFGTITATAVNAATLAATTSVTATSASAVALAVGLTGATNSAFVVDSSTASQAAGLKVTGAATGGTVAVAAIDSGAAANITVNAKGTGTIGIGSVSTGAVTITPATTVTGVLTQSSIGLVKATNAITAFATGGQASATALVSQINSITTCATAGDSVKLPVSAAGTEVIVSNLGAAYANVFPVSGDLIDALAVNTAVSLPSGSSIRFNCAVAGSWKSSVVTIPAAKFTTGTTTTTFAAGQLTGAATTVYENTQATPGSIATRTATQMFADDQTARVGYAYRLRINNNQGTGTLTVTAGGGVTLTGTATIAINTYRDFVITYTSAIALVMQQVGIGTSA